MYSERGVDSVTGEVGCSVDDGEIGFLESSVFELLCDLPLGDVVFCDDHNSGSVSVEAVYDARSELAESRGEIVAIVGESVYESAVGIAAGGVDDHVGGFVEDD